jgi:hypothetical protein
VTNEQLANTQKYFNKMNSYKNSMNQSRLINQSKKNNNHPDCICNESKGKKSMMIDTEELVSDDNPLSTNPKSPLSSSNQANFESKMYQSYQNMKPKFEAETKIASVRNLPALNERSRLTKKTRNIRTQQSVDFIQLSL